MDVPIDGTTTRTVIIDDLKQSGSTQEGADEVFNQALEQGIIDQQNGVVMGFRFPLCITGILTSTLEAKAKTSQRHPSNYIPRLMRYRCLPEKRINKE